MWEILILIITITWLVHKLTSLPKNFPPGPPSIPLLGSLPFIDFKNLQLELERLRGIYGPVIGLKLGYLNVAAVCGPKEVLEALKSDDFSARPPVTTVQREAEGIMFANGSLWKDQRRFTLRHLRDFGFGKTSMAETVKMEIEEFCEKKIKNQKIIQGTGLINVSAINILWAMMAGKRLSYNDEDLKTLLINLEKLFRVGNPISNLVPGLKKLLSLFYEPTAATTERMLKEFILKAIEEHRKTKTDEHRDFIDVYLTELENPERKESFKEEVLIEVCKDLFKAGSESSSNTVSFALMYLLLHPDWQEKLIAEIEKELAGRPPTLDDRLSLPLVEAFLSEVQRSNTIAPLTVPHCTSKDTVLNGYNIPKGTFVHVSIWSLLQDKQHWGDPENFRPERFLDDQGKYKKDPFMLLFGAGPRICPGDGLARNFVFLFFVSLLQRYRFVQPEGHPPPSTKGKFGFTAAPHPFVFQAIPI